MLKITSALIAFTLALAPLGASARQEIEVGEPTYPRAFVDVDSIKGQGDVKVWSRIAIDEDDYPKGLRSRSILSLNQIAAGPNLEVVTPIQTSCRTVWSSAQSMRKCVLLKL